MSKTATIKLTAAIGIAGQLVPRGEIITVPEAAAKDLLRRGKAELATEADDPEHDEADAKAEPEAEDAESEAVPQAAATTTAKPSGKKK